MSTRFLNVFFAGILFAIILFGTGCSKGADEARRASRTIHPKAVQALEAAREAMMRKDYPLVFALADTADAYEKELIHTDFLRGQVYVDTYQLEKADSTFKKVHQSDPYYRGVWFKLGQSAFLRSEYDRAIRLFEREKKLIEDSPGKVRQMYRDVDATALIAADLQIGRSYQKAGKVDSAIVFYRQVLAADSSSANGHAWLAELLQETGEIDEAMSHALHAFRLDRENLEYAYLCGALYYRTGKIDEAIKTLRPIVARTPWHEGANYNLGQALQRKGQSAEARVYLARADTLAKLGYKIQMSESAARVQSTSPQRWLILADLYLAAGRIDDAQKAMQTAHYLLPDNLSIQNDLGNLALVRGDTTGAFFQFIRILQQDSTFVDGWINLGVIYAMTNRKQDARIAWEQARKYRPADPTVKNYLASVSDHR